MKILVTGASGFIGRHLVRKLVGLGLDCRCAVEDRQDAAPLWKDVEIVDGKATSPECVLSWVEGCTHVVHLDARVVERELSRRDRRSADVEETANLIAACETSGIRLLVYCSSAGAVGIRDHAAYDLQAPLEARELKAERLVLTAAERGGIRAIVARLDSVYGPEDVRLVPLYAAIQKGRFFLVGKGDALVRPTYVEDAVEGLIACLNHPEQAGKVFNIGGPDQLTAREFVHGIQGALGVAPRIVLIPRFMAYAGALVCEGLSVVTKRTPLLSTGSVRSWSVHHCPSA